LYCKFGKSSKENIPQKVKTLWRNMLNRCYNPLKDKYEYYGGSGVTVSNDWLNEYTFYKDIQTLENYNRWIEDKDHIYSLDKDLLNKDIKIYSIDTCKFITRDEQNQLHEDVHKIEVVHKYSKEKTVYNSMNKASEALGIYRSIIGRIINNEMKNKTDYIFKILNDGTENEMM